MENIISKIISESNYDITQFTEQEVEEVGKMIRSKLDKKGNMIYYISCQVRNKDIKLTGEELVRQLYINKLINTYQYPVDKMELEYQVTFGREKKRADIVIFDKINAIVPYIIVELKKPKLKDGKEQLKSYCNATGAPIGVWTNGDKISFYHRKDPNYFEDITNIPKFTEKLSDILEERWKIADLIAKDKLVTERKSLKDLILEMEDEVLANAGVDVFEEIFKLIFTKLYDEMECGRDGDRILEFRNYGDTDSELKDKIQNIFDKAKEKWEGVFSSDSKILLSPSHLSVCVSSLQDVKLFNSNLDIVDDAFEYLMNKSSKGEKGQYFTPRYVIDMCVKMLNPTKEETMIDTASGSCGFPVHTIFYVWKQILKEKGIKQSHLFTSQKKPIECSDYVNSKVFAIDFDEKAVRVARTLNLISGDGQTNVLHLNTLDYERWDDIVRDESWTDTYNNGWKKFKKLRKIQSSNRDFCFDVLMANPPFAGDVKESRIITKYELGKNAKGKYQTKVGRDILFIERNLDFLKPGGRMAVILPQGRFNNSTDKYIRDYISNRCRILAVVGLHGNVFKPHTGTKTSVLFVQKWDDKLCPKLDDYPIFFATMQEPSKDNSGDKIYETEEFIDVYDRRNMIKDTPERITYTREEFYKKYSSLEDVYMYCLKSGSTTITKKHYDNLPEREQKLYEKKMYAESYSKLKLDKHGHLIVKHDLYNHDGLTQDGIAEAFIEFAKKEGLSFF
ncbi:TPA: N-6 DNA methylase [Clostridioides difficile]|nr:N-6 DNA methylase [Clostridioides difficile]